MNRLFFCKNGQVQLYITPPRFFLCNNNLFHGFLYFSFHPERRNLASKQNSPNFISFMKLKIKALLEYFVFKDEFSKGFQSHLHILVWFKNDMLWHFHFQVELKKSTFGTIFISQISNLNRETPKIYCRQNLLL